ncbi:MAG: hypothetical protein P4L84_18440 [Isosphaeraceae bacterium]|nr:hypothetical protein [Isosphaeraceae bacterium]
MATTTITLLEDTAEWIASLVAKGLISDSSAYVQDLVLQDWRRRNRERTDELLIEGLDSGPAMPFTEQNREEIRKVLR